MKEIDVQSKIRPLELNLLEAQELQANLTSKLTEWNISNQSIERSILDAQQNNEYLVRNLAELSASIKQTELDISYRKFSDDLNKEIKLKNDEIQSLKNNLFEFKSKLDATQQGKFFLLNLF